MSAAVEGGPVSWGMSTDGIGHRTYKVRWQVGTTNKLDGPFAVFNAAGLPLVGSAWSGIANDVDLWAFCSPKMNVSSKINDGDPCKKWWVDQEFTTLPFRRCQDTQIEDPLSEPQSISGSFVKYTALVGVDYNNKRIKSSSHETILVEKDANRPTVIIGQNVLNLGLDVFSGMIDHVNDSGLWGLGARCVKLSNVVYERKLYGICTYYYTRRFDFDIRYNTFDDADIPDRGFNVLRGDWGKALLGQDPHVWYPIATDATNPNNFEVFKDEKGARFPVQTALDGLGNPSLTPESPTFLPTVKKYPEANLYDLDIPSSL